MPETTTITTPIKKVEVVLKAYTTGADEEAIESAILNATHVEGQNTQVSGQVVQLARHAALRTIVLSVGGSSENVVEDLKALPAKDYKFVCDKVNEITEGMTEQKKS